MAHNVIIKRAVAGFNVDSYNRTVVADVAMDNGCVFTLSREEANDLRWTPSIAAAASTTGLWMATSPEVMYVDKSAGLSVDPRDFTNKAGKSIDATLLVKGDIIEMTGEGIADIATSDYLVADAGVSFGLKASGSAAEGFTLKKIGTSTLKIGDGAIAPQPVATYVYEVVNN